MCAKAEAKYAKGTLPRSGIEQTNWIDFAECVATYRIWNEEETRVAHRAPLFASESARI